MLEKVFYKCVLVSDQDKALDFYTNVLGLERRVENPTPDAAVSHRRRRGRRVPVGSLARDTGAGRARRWVAPRRRSRLRPTIAARRWRS
ncbi:MAG: VOC family protein [Solirubrobacteraceae bacterium]